MLPRAYVYINCEKAQAYERDLPLERGYRQAGLPV